VLHGPAFLLGLGNALQEFLAPLQQLFLEALDPFLIHLTIRPQGPLPHSLYGT
jgi:hypothetical protein